MEWILYPFLGALAGTLLASAGLRLLDHILAGRRDRRVREERREEIFDRFARKGR